MEETVDTGIREANAADRAEAAEGAEHAPPDAREKTEGEESLETRFDAMIRGEMKELYEQAVRRETERALLAAQQAQQQAAQRAAMVQRLEAEEAQVKEVYPTFDLEKEAGNPEFAALLKRGVSMKQAFEVLHMDELMQGAMQYTAAKVQQTTARNMNNANSIRLSKLSTKPLERSRSAIFSASAISSFVITVSPVAAAKTARGSRCRTCR